MRRRIRRARTRGAVYVEGLIVLSFMLIFFAGQLFFYHRYKAEMEGFNLTSGSAFQVASAGCGAPLGASYDIPKLLSPSAPNPRAANPDPAYLGPTTNQIVISVGFSGSKPNFMGGGGWSRSVQTEIMCSEPPMDAKTIFASLGAIPWAINGAATAAGF